MQINFKILMKWVKLRKILPRLTSEEICQYPKEELRNLSKNCFITEIQL